MKKERNGDVTRELEEELVGTEIAYRIIKYMEGKTFDRRSREVLSVDIIERILWENHTDGGGTWGDIARSIAYELGADEEEVLKLLDERGVV